MTVRAELGPGVVDDAAIELLLERVADDATTVELIVAEPGMASEGLFVPLLGLLGRVRRRDGKLLVQIPAAELFSGVADNLLTSLVLLYADGTVDDNPSVSDTRSSLIAHLNNVDGAIASTTTRGFVSSNLPGTERMRDIRLPRVFAGKYFEVRDELEVAIVALTERFELRMSRRQLDHLVTFAHEAVLNAREHGYITAKGESIAGCRLVRFRVLSGDEVRHAQSPLAHYLQRLDKSDGAASFLEVAVGDPGRGIASTISNDDLVFERPIDIERARFTLALSPRGTSKSNKTGAGRGLVRMTRAVHELRGFMAFRTGRLFLCRHFLDPMGRLEPEAFDEGDMTFYHTYDWERAVMPRIEGTHVYCVVPFES